MPPPPASSYDHWSKEDLIARLRQIDRVHPHPTGSPSALTDKFKHKSNPFNFAAHPRRKIALKFCYNGSQYGGLEYQKIPTPLPTVEGVLFDALVYTRLVDPEGGLDGCGWEKCGRTDRGVSAAQQVISLWVRSAIGDINAGDDEDMSKDKGSTEAGTPLGQEGTVTADDAQPQSIEESAEDSTLDGDFDLMGDWDEAPTNSGRNLPTSTPEELKYVSTLNNVLPPTIRVLAWSPVADSFSARFNCYYRHYKYFFTSDGLDIPSMQEGAARLVGEHDFRNLCKLDPGKQLTTFNRKIGRATISPVDGGESSNLYVFDLIGTAFLYNQVRHIMAILFLVGSNLEHPSIITALMNTDPENPLPPPTPNEPPPPIIESKPEYQMADALPLILWECGYKESDVQWQTDVPPSPDKPISQTDLSSNVYMTLQNFYTRSLLSTALDQHFLKAAALYHAPPPQYLPLNRIGEGDGEVVERPSGSVLSIPLGGATFRRGQRYVPILERKRLDGVEVANERWRTGKGAKRWAKILEKRNGTDSAQERKARDDDVDE